MRDQAHDARPSIDERYPTRERYLALVEEAGRLALSHWDERVSHHEVAAVLGSPA